MTLRDRLARAAIRCVLAFIVLMLAAGTAVAQQVPVRASGAAGPMPGVRPEAWSAAGTFITNNSDSDADALVALSFDLSPDVQFARQVWSPAHSMIRAWIPFHAPTFTPGSNVILKAETLLVDAHAASTEHWLMREQSLMVGQREQNSNIVAMLSTHDDTSTMVVAARRSIDSNNRQSRAKTATVIAMGLDRLPSVPQTLGDFDSLVLGDAIGHLDLAQMQNIRQWVQSGGMLWIIAGETDDDQLQLLLGDAWSARTIDRTELQDFLIEQDRTGSTVSRHPPVRVQRDDPVELLRVSPGENMTVLERVNGYPAAMKFPLGLGRVFVTTLAPAGWAQTSTAASAALGSIAEDMFPIENRDSAVASRLATSLAELAPAQVGYHIVPRSMVLTVMAGFCIAFLITGAALLHYGKMEWFAVFGTGLAAVASLAMLAEAHAVHGATPLTIASAGVAQVFPDASAVREQSTVALYNPAGAAGPLASETGGVFWPTRGTPLGRQTRLLFTDRDRWQWPGLSVPEGSMLRGNFSASTDLPSPVGALLRLSETGAEATVASGPFGALEDVLLAGPNGALLVHGGSNGTITTAGADLAHNDQYIVGSVLSDSQRQHQEIYRQLLAAPSMVNEPTLLGFSSAPVAGVSVPQEAQRRDTLLVSMPIEFVPPENGASLTVPSALIPFAVNWVTGSFAYSPMNHSWNTKTSNNTGTSFSYLQFTLPRGLLPMKLSAVTFDMTIRAPGRDVALVKVINRAPIPIVSVQSPLGLVEAKMTGADCPAIDAQGRIVLGFTVGVDSDRTQTWEITDARLTVTGQKLPRVADDAPQIRLSIPVETTPLKQPSRNRRSGTAHE